MPQPIETFVVVGGLLVRVEIGNEIANRIVGYFCWFAHCLNVRIWPETWESFMVGIVSLPLDSRRSMSGDDGSDG